MDKSAKWVLSIVVLLLIVVGLFVAFSPSPEGKETRPIKLGAIMPLSGDAAAYGIPIQQATDLAIKEINAAGGVDGRMIKVVYENGACAGKEATSAAQKLINVDKIKVILGGLCSGETLGAAPVAEENKVILFSPGSGSPDITKSGDYIFRNFPSDATSGGKVAQAAIDNGHKKVAIIAEQTEYAQAVKEVFKTTFEAAGGEILTDESYASDSSDFRTQLTKMKATNPDGLYVLSQTPAKYGLVLKQISELGMNQQIYSNEFSAAEDILKDYKEEIEGAIYAEPSFDDKAPKAKELLDKILAEHGELSGALPPVYFATAYDAVYLLKDALVECGEDTDCIKKFLYGVTDRAGTAGMLTIDENGDASFSYVLRTIKDGKAMDV